MHCWRSVATAALIGLSICAVTPTSAEVDGSDWCQPLKPCNETKTDAVRIESGYGLGLLNKASSTTTYFQYSDTTPATTMDWRQALTDWDVRDQGTCGELSTSMVLVLQAVQ